LDLLFISIPAASVCFFFVVVFFLWLEEKQRSRNAPNNKTRQTYLLLPRGLCVFVVFLFFSFF